LTKVLFLVDANKRLGMGHITRCLELARNLKRLKVSSYFLVSKNSSILQLIHDMGFFVVQTSGNTSNNRYESSYISKICSKEKFDCLIIDSRTKRTKSFFKKLNKICKTVVISNDTHPSSLNANLIILPEIKQQYPTSFLNKSTKMLVGSKYTLLGKLKRLKKIKRDNSILISMGSTDKRNLTKKIIVAFKKTKFNFHAKIVIGRFFKESEQLVKSLEKDKRFTIIKNKDSLIPFMQTSKIGIFTMGVTTYEALYCGLPSLIISHSKENDQAARKMSSLNCIRYLGYYKSVDFDRMPHISSELMNNPKLRTKYVKNGQKLVDGKGSDRVAKKIAEIISHKKAHLY
jgi:spore coat polysaccharide biosynthesis predicted glycosyltransferase SpsG